MPEIEVALFESLNTHDDPNPAKQKEKEEIENQVSQEKRAINNFKNQDKVVYSPKASESYPKVIIVTAIDFDKYEVSPLANIVQNRVNYAHAHDYGIYVRWHQEFAPFMNSIQFVTAKERAKWARLYCLRAAMFAFPKAEWFWYLDQDGLIMNLKVNLYDYLLSDEALERAALRDQPVVPPNGLIKTHKNLHSENVKLVVTQSESKIGTNSFIVRNDEIGRGMLDLWGDKLFVNYNNFPYGPDSAISHILQWHPFLLSKTAIVQARTINSVFTSETLEEDAKNGDHIHYFKGDLVATWSGCTDPTLCTNILGKLVTLSQQ